MGRRAVWDPDGPSGSGRTPGFRARTRGEITGITIHFAERAPRILAKKNESRLAANYPGLRVDRRQGRAATTIRARHRPCHAEHLPGGAFRDAPTTDGRAPLGAVEVDVVLRDGADAANSRAAATRFELRTQRVQDEAREDVPCDGLLVRRYEPEGQAGNGITVRGESQRAGSGQYRCTDSDTLQSHTGRIQ